MNTLQYQRSRWAKAIAIKAAGGQGHPLQNNYGGNYNAAPTTATKTHRATAKGLETVFFTFVNSTDVAYFEKKKTTLSR